MAARVWCSNLDDHKAVNKLDSTSMGIFSRQTILIKTRLVVMGYQSPETVELNGLTFST